MRYVPREPKGRSLIVSAGLLFLLVSTSCVYIVFWSKNAYPRRYVRQEMARLTVENVSTMTVFDKGSSPKTTFYCQTNNLILIG